MTTETRIMSASLALGEFCKYWRWTDDEIIQDLICNLLHLAEKRGENPALIMELARLRFECTRAGIDES